MYRDWTYWEKPLPGFGDPNARLLIIGLAPAAHGGTRTGRMFCGDGSGDFLTGALHRAGFSNKPTSVSREDGLVLGDVYLTAVVRCAPPKNKPQPREIASCRSYLERELELLKSVRVILALGRIAFDSYLRMLKDRKVLRGSFEFKHGARYELPEPYPILFASYHPSRQNTQTGKLTVGMLDGVFAEIKRELDQQTN